MGIVKKNVICEKVRILGHPKFKAGNGRSCHLLTMIMKIVSARWPVGPS